jgi:hypothetical protein
LMRIYSLLSKLSDKINADSGVIVGLGIKLIY